ncbi:probable insulin-like peptide 7 [Octopus bimaculoides]|uniref:Insulin-like domain-containing protein n=1 Tax=Octopus bimaculoides TaxID=37653 RepID=A0A0L8G9S5_OCTBM|nr:probable insulin-like peptide 7 [Octopus bimaculoides]XP_052821902.1 probable insulin-like peptide 7 [Octopus bimaculoides]|eukprot:XP_014782891.1 PREDICTED: probable insulin-like peptide 7 [Octopus bimaculoides]
MKRIRWQEASIKAVFYISVLFNLLIDCRVKANIQEDVIEIIQGRNFQHWRNVWNQECFRRCRAELGPHISIACQNDIYKIINKRPPRRLRRSTNISVDTNDVRRPLSQHQLRRHRRSLRFPFLLQDSEAFSYLKREHTMVKRGQAGGIMEECCYMKGCTWEEYAEFCHSHSRYQTSGENGNCPTF